MITFQSFLKKQILIEKINIDAFQFPPLAYGSFGKYFIAGDGEIHYQVAGEGGNQNGIAHVNNFLPIYQKFFSQHITPEMAKQFKEKYTKNMADEKDDISKNNLPFPEIFNSPFAKWIVDNDEVIYKIKTAQGEQQGISSIKEFDAYYKQNIANFGNNQLANINPEEKESIKQKLNKEIEQ